MSLVNRMLQDLEQRRAELPRGDSLRGLRAAPPAAQPRRNLWPTVLIAAALGGVAYGWWLTFAAHGLEAPPPSATAPAAMPRTWVAEKQTAPPAAAAQTDAQLDAAWDKTWEPRTADAVSVAALEETLPERTALVAAQPATPTPPTIEPPAPRPAPTTTATAIVRAAPAPAPSMRKTPRAPSATEQAAQDYATALGALRVGDAARAEEHLRAALDRIPGQTQAAETLAALLLRHGRAQEAEDVLAEAIAAAPQTPNLLKLHARLLAETGRDTEAVALLQTPPLSGDAEAHALLGALQQRLGHDTQAADAYRQALTRAPQRGAWWLGLAISLERSQQPAAALEAYRRALTDSALDAHVTGYVRGRIAALADGKG